MTHHGGRNPKAFLRRLAMQFGYRDRTPAKTINTLPAEYIMAELQKEYEGIDVSAVLTVERGEVLIDSRGKGSFQKGYDVRRSNGGAC